MSAAPPSAPRASVLTIASRAYSVLIESEPGSLQPPRHRRCWTAGGGLEYAVLPNATVKAEYLHMDLGHQNVKLTVQSPATGNGFVNVRFSNAYEIVRMGMNFRF